MWQCSQVGVHEFIANLPVLNKTIPFRHAYSVASMCIDLNLRMTSSSRCNCRSTDVGGDDVEPPSPNVDDAAVTGDGVLPSREKNTRHKWYYEKLIDWITECKYARFCTTRQKDVKDDDVMKKADLNTA